jgi:hypothetical protein
MNKKLLGRKFKSKESFVFFAHQLIKLMTLLAV